MSDIMVGARFIRVSYYNGNFNLELCTSKEKHSLNFGTSPVALVLFMQANAVQHFDLDFTVSDNTVVYETFTRVARQLGLGV